MKDELCLIDVFVIAKQLASLDGLALYFDTDAKSIYQQGDRRGEMMKSFQSLVSSHTIDHTRQLY